MSKSDSATKPRRIAGMTVHFYDACLVVLERHGDEWRVTFAWFGDWSEMERARNPDCPVILDAFCFGQTAICLRAAGWDVRPPLWVNGVATNPSSEQLRTCGSATFCATDSSYSEVGRIRAGDTFNLAAWGATHPTSAEPPTGTRVHEQKRVPAIDRDERRQAYESLAEILNRGPATLDASQSAIAWSACRQAAKRDGAPVNSLDTVQAAIDSGRILFDPSMPATLAPAPGRIEKQRDEAERLLLGMVQHVGTECCADSNQAPCSIVPARAYLVSRGLLDDGKVTP